MATFDPQRESSCDSLEELLGLDEIEVVLNLTPPQVHYQVSLAIIGAGKHVYSEKPLSCTDEEADALLENAQKIGVKVGCAPDTVLGSSIQTCRELIDQGAIGRPLHAQCFMLCRGHESWHPNPGFFYESGAGPMLDMGPYYLTALVHLLGPVQLAKGLSRAHFDVRPGTEIKPTINTHVMGLLEFASGATGSLVTSFDTHPFPFPHMVIFGESGNMVVPDPNGFGGEIVVNGHPQPLTFPYEANSRGIGVVEMLAEPESRVSGAIARHVLNVMNALAESKSAEIALVDQPKPMPKKGYT